MSSPKAALRICNAEEIAEKRRAAEERLKKTKQKNENGLNNNNKSQNHETPILKNLIETMRRGLTEEQRVEIEKNRLAAISRAEEKGNISKETAKRLQSKEPPFKVLPVTNNNRAHPYSKPIDKIINDNDDSKPKEHNQAQYQNPVQGPFSKPLVPIICELEVISEERFIARTDKYSDAVISIFKNISSKYYDRSSRDWTFKMQDYDQLKSLLEANDLKSRLVVNGVPDFVLKQLQKEIPHVSSSSLDNIEPFLINSLWDFQKEAVCFGIARGGRVMIADEMGLGKTRESLAVADYYKNDWPLLIVTTAAMRNQWHKEILKLLPSLEIHKIRILEKQNDQIIDTKVVICSYSAMEYNIKKLEQREFGVIIFDESHSLKNRYSKQTMNALSLGKKAARVILLTGTPAMAKPSELFPQLDIIDERFANYRDFTTRYSQGFLSQFGWNAKGSSNLTELNVILRKNFMIRRVKADVNTELADKTREVIKLDNLSLNAKLNDSMLDFAQNFQQAQGQTKQESILLSWFVQTAKLKIPAVCHFIENLLKEDQEKILIFATHHCVMDGVSNSLTNNQIHFVRIDGTTRPETRKQNVESFQSDSNIRCAVLSIKACCAGITLTAASKVVFAELDWTPCNILQAESRAHRIGQQHQVKSYILIALGTSDPIMWEMLLNKQRNLTKIGLVASDEHLSEATNLKIQDLNSISKSNDEHSSTAESEEIWDDEEMEQIFQAEQASISKAIPLNAHKEKSQDSLIEKSKVDAPMIFSDDDDMDFVFDLP